MPINIMMTLNEYQNMAMSFRLSTATEDYALFNLGAEVGEVLSLRAKALRDGKKFDYDQNIKKELGDVLWHVAAIAIDNGFSLEDVAMSNISKLSLRKANNTIQGSGDDR